MLVITGRLQVRLKWVVARRASIVSKINYTFKWSITEKSERQETQRVKITTFVLIPQMPKWQINFSFKTHRNSTEKTVTWILKVVAKLIPWPVYQGFSCACGRMFRGRAKVEATRGQVAKKTPDTQCFAWVTTKTLTESGNPAWNSHAARVQN